MLVPFFSLPFVVFRLIVSSDHVNEEKNPITTYKGIKQTDRHEKQNNKFTIWKQDLIRNVEGPIINLFHVMHSKSPYLNTFSPKLQGFCFAQKQNYQISRKEVPRLFERLSMWLQYKCTRRGSAVFTLLAKHVCVQCSCLWWYGWEWLRVY